MGSTWWSSTSSGTCTSSDGGRRTTCPAGPTGPTLFVEKAASAGLFVNLRIGPYVCAEWNYGGLPVWLNSIPGMKLRSSVDPWEGEMEHFSTDMVKLAEPYLARNGGPIILAQIENEFQFDDDPSYVAWCGQLAAQLAIGVPWLMCSGQLAAQHHQRMQWQ